MTTQENTPELSSGRQRLEAAFSIDADLDPAERGWRDRARRFAQTEIAPIAEQDWEDTEFRGELFSRLGAEGFLGMHLDAPGCAGTNAVSYGLVCAELEAVDSGWRTAVSVQGSLAMTAIARFGSEEQRELWLPPMARGSVIGCFALTEPHGGSDPGDMRTTAVREGEDWVITGAKRWIGLANVAAIAVVWAQTSAGIRGFLVPTDTPGFAVKVITGKRSMRSSRQCDILLDEVRVPASAQLLGAHGLSAPFTCLNEARFGIIWGATGAARCGLEVSLDRVAEREVFGTPLAGRQLVQAELAEMLVEYSRGLTLALHLGRGRDRGTLTRAEISIGKLSNVRGAIAVLHRARMLLGGDGITDEFPIMRHLANLEAVRTNEGTDGVHTLILGQALTGIPAYR